MTQEKNKAVVVYTRAEDNDIPAIMDIVRQAEAAIADSTWYVSMDAAYARDNIDRQGLVIKAVVQSVVAGFLLIHYPMDEEDNMGVYLDLSSEEMNKVAYMDTVCVRPAYRGLGIQSALLCHAEQQLQPTAFRYYMATVHPDNIYSLRNFLNNGYEIVTTTEKYGGLPRHVLLKRKPLAGEGRSGNA